jgi:parallel beta-helix repeat protein
VFDNGNPSSSAHAIYGVNWYVLSGLTIKNIGVALIVWEGCGNVVLTNLTVSGTGHQGIFVYDQSHHVLVVNSVIHGTGLASNGEGFYIGCNDFLDNTHDITIRGNRIYDTASEGIELKPGTYNCVVENNTLYTCNKGGGGFGSGGGCIEVDENSGISYYNGNANHIIRGNLIYDTVIGIRMARGGKCYNNIIYGVSDTGIAVNTSFGPDDGYVRYIYNNTVDLVSTKAVVRTAGTASILNNIGPSTAYNLAANSAYFVNMAGHDYHLVAGAAPINTGTNLFSVVATDFDGNARSSAGAFDVGAYEYGGVVRPSPPGNLRLAGP